MKQIRIYYECLEQGLNYIKPIVQEVVDEDVDIVLIRRPKKAADLNDGAVAALLSMTTPDALITGVANDIEVPLIVIEFTEAVTTEDHELQRTYGAIAAHLAGAYYLKLAGEKESEKVFGGAQYNPYTTPRIFIDETGYEGYIIAKWETIKDNSFTLERNEHYPSCPPEIRIFKDAIQEAVRAFIRFPSQWYEHSISELKQKTSYIDYRKIVDQASGTQQLLWSWENRRDTNLNKLRYFVRKEWIGAKINRFSHAMDPDRGILTFISFLFSKHKKIYGIYALVRPRGDDLMKQDMTCAELMQQKLNTALQMDAGGIPNWLSAEIIDASKSVSSLTEEVDFTPVWRKYKNRLSENKVVMTLAYFLDGIYLNHNGIKLTWDKRSLIDTTDADFLNAFAVYFGFRRYVAPTPIREITDEVDEDEVSYAFIHKVLKPNGFKIVSASYPGAQGSCAVLPNPELGKAQPREYPDIIALPPEGSNIDVVLNESKGMFSAPSMSKDLEKMLKYKTELSHNKALKETLSVAQVIGEDDELRNIVIGVSFGVGNRTSITWRPTEVDFIFRIVNRNRWAIAIFQQELASLIPCIEGNTDYPKLYKCNK